MDELFFSKSKETFSTCPIEAWGRMRKHLEQLNAYKSKKLHDSYKYNALSRYIRQVERDVEYLEKTTSFVFVEVLNEIPKFCNECRDTYIKVIPCIKRIIS
jgi:hypothetical protein